LFIVNILSFCNNKLSYYLFKNLVKNKINKIFMERIKSKSKLKCTFRFFWAAIKSWHKKIPPDFSTGRYLLNWVMVIFRLFPEIKPWCETVYKSISALETFTKAKIICNQFGTAFFTSCCFHHIKFTSSDKALEPYQCFIISSFTVAVILYYAIMPELI